jgi:AraC-like DNA-binding protein
VCFVGSGSGQARVARAFEPCGPGEHIVKAWAREFETEIVEASPDEPFRSLMIQFSSEEIESAFKEIGSCLPASSRLPSGYKSLWVPTARVSRTDADFMATVANYFSSLVSDDIIPRRLLLPLRRREVLYRLLLPLIQQKVDDEINFTGIVAGAKNRAGSFDLQPVLDLMAENLAEPLSVAELAERVHMSPSRFAHVFAEQAGISPQQMRKRLRLHRARVLLDREGWSVSAAAGEVGYSNDSHFIREFKRFFGTTPGRYTKEIASA